MGQKFSATPGTRPSDWDERHCLPLAERTEDLSRIPYVSHGSNRVLRQRGLGDVAAVAQAAVTRAWVAIPARKVSTWAWAMSRCS